MSDQALGQVQAAYAGHEPDILRAKTLGYMRILTEPHRFGIPVQVGPIRRLLDLEQPIGRPRILGRRGLDWTSAGCDDT